MLRTDLEGLDPDIQTSLIHLSEEARKQADLDRVFIQV